MQQRAAFPIIIIRAILMGENHFLYFGFGLDFSELNHK